MREEAEARNRRFDAKARKEANGRKRAGNSAAPGPPLFLSVSPVRFLSRFRRSFGPAGFALSLLFALSPFSSPAAADSVKAAGWRLALPGYRFQFPRDHASHPAYQTEWWYYTGHLRAEDGRTFGFELTFFRIGVRPPGTGGHSAWTLHNLYAAHFALTDEAGRRFFSTDRLSRGALGMAGAATGRYHVWIENWSVGLELNNSSNVHHLRAARDRYHLDLFLRSAKPPAINGQGGISQKSAGRGHASHYYSLTRLRGAGTLATPEGRFSVTALAWMDHEFGSSQLAPDQVGWDWFSLQLDDDRELMLYQLRRRDGRADSFSSGTLVERDGTTRHLGLSDFRVTVLDHWRSPKTGALYPSRWRVQVPSAHLDVLLTPTVADQELVTSHSTGVAYWEGSVRIAGSAHGRGYVELTGYARQFTAPM